MAESPGRGLERYDDVAHFWCPMLGQPMRFGYCRTMQKGLPCHRVPVCFQPHFPVAEFLEENYTEEQRNEFLKPARGRMETVAEALAGAEKKEAT